jgi:uncharacterized protein (TIRG00374 family)
LKQSFPLFISVLILVAIYWQIDIILITKVLFEANLFWLTLGFGMVVPITLLTAHRLTWMIPYDNQLSYFNSLKLILAACTMNIVLPSKMGDVAKSLFIANNDSINSSQALSLVMLEKISDFLALLIWCFFGLIIYKYNYWINYLLVFILLGIIFVILILFSVKFSQSFFKIISIVFPVSLEKKIHRFTLEWKNMVLYLKLHKKRFTGLIFYSLFLWFLHLIQLWLFILALNSFVPFIHNLALTPQAILIGLLPFTIAGIGTRDAAFIFIYSNYFSAATGAALGLLATMRYMIPAIFGLPFLSLYMRKFLTKSDFN